MQQIKITGRRCCLVLSVAVITQGFAAEDYQAPHTEFGVPDVQGVWTFETRTTLERPASYEGQLEVDEATMLAKMVSTPVYIAALEA